MQLTEYVAALQVSAGWLSLSWGADERSRECPVFKRGVQKPVWKIECDESFTASVSSLA